MKKNDRKEPGTDNDLIPFDEAVKKDSDEAIQASDINDVDDESISKLVSEYLVDDKAENKTDFFSDEKADDLLSEIEKNIPEAQPTRFNERTTRRAKYENEQHFVSADNPYQRNKDDTTELREKTPDVEVVEAPKKELKTFNDIFRDAAHKFFPNKNDAKPEFIRKLIKDISAFVLIGCAIAAIVIAVQSNKSEKQQAGLSSQIIDISSEAEEEKMWDNFYAKYPNITMPEGMMAKYAYLYALNQQLVGWISVPNSGIDVQVVKSNNNMDYLKKDFYGNYSRYGCPFMDYRNDAKYLNQNTIIYGHHMSDGLVFAELSKYKTLDGFIESPVIQFDTLYKSYKFKVYAAFITNSREEDDNGYIFNYTVTSFGSTQNFDDYIAALDERKLYTTGVDINSGDKLITLSTCTYEFTDARLVVVGRMLRSGETTDVDTTYSTTNGNPHYPQVWYDKSGKTNPFANSEKWYPES